MKKLKLNSILTIAAIIAVVFFSACNKTSDPSVTSLIIDKTWVLEAVNMAGMDMTPAEILASEGAEYQMTLKADGTLVYADNMGMNPINGKWVMQLNDTQFVVSGIDPGMTDTNTITKLTSTELWFWHMDGADKMTMHYKLK